MLLSSKTVISLSKTVEDLDNTTIYADNFFSSIPLVEYLKEQYRCRYVGTAIENRVENPPTPPLPKQGQRSEQPDVKTRVDVKIAHMPVALKQRETF